jgi:hypothetical protein
LNEFIESIYHIQIVRRNLFAFRPIKCRRYKTISGVSGGSVRFPQHTLLSVPLDRHRIDPMRPEE